MNVAAKFQSLYHERKHFFRKKKLFDRLEKREEQKPRENLILFMKDKKTRKHQPVFLQSHGKTVKTFSKLFFLIFLKCS